MSSPNASARIVAASGCPKLPYTESQNAESRSGVDSSSWHASTIADDAELVDSVEAV
jgi:hypothetical protein